MDEDAADLAARGLAGVADGADRRRREAPAALTRWSG